MTWPAHIHYLSNLANLHWEYKLCCFFESVNCAACFWSEYCPVQFFNYCRANLLVWGIIFPKTFRPLIKLLCISRSKYEVHNSMCTSSSHWNINQWTKSYLKHAYIKCRKGTHYNDIIKVLHFCSLCKTMYFIVYGNNLKFLSVAILMIYWYFMNMFLEDVKSN